MSHIAVPLILPSHSSLPVCCILFPVRVGILQTHPCLTTCSCCHVDIMLGPWSARKTNHEQQWCCVSSVQRAKLCPQTPPWDVGLFQWYQSAAFQQGQGIPTAFLMLPHTQRSLWASCRLRAESDQLEIARPQPPAVHYRVTVEVQQLPFQDPPHRGSEFPACSSIQVLPREGVITEFITENCIVNWLCREGQRGSFPFDLTS